jgi:hypothetical protein
MATQRGFLAVAFTIIGGVLSFVVEHGSQSMGVAHDIIALATCNYRFENQEPGPFDAEHLHDGIVDYSTRSGCARRDPQIREIVVNSQGGENQQIWLDNLTDCPPASYSLCGVPDPTGRKLYHLLYHMPVNGTGFERRAVFAWPNYEGAQTFTIKQLAK